MLETLISIIGPPAVGKTALALRLGASPGYEVFRLREHVSAPALVAAATSAEQLGWLDDPTVSQTLRSYLDTIAHRESAHTVLLDNFPGSDTQVRLLLSLLGQLAPTCLVHVVEMMAARTVVLSRAQSRRVCHSCERDPIDDPRLPAQACATDPRRCARCNDILYPRQNDSPLLIQARLERYARAVAGIRSAFSEAHIKVLRCDADRSAEEIAVELSLLISIGSSP